MATYDEQILNFFAEAVSEDIGLSQSMFDVWCVDGAMDVISKMPEELLEKFGNLTADKTTDGYTSNLPLYVLRENGTDGKYVTCRKIDGGLLFEWEQNLATKNDPAWYVKDGKVYVLPTPGASPDAFKVYEVTKPTIDASADSSISYFPNELEKLAAVIYPVIMGKMRQVEKMRRNSQDELEAITTSGYLADFEDALPTFILPASPSLPSLSLVSLGTVPSFNAASLEFDPPTMQTLPTFVEQVINSISDLTAPGDITLPSSGAITFPTLSLPAVPVAILTYTSAGSAPSSTVTVSETLPTYGGPTNVVIDITAIDDKLDSDYQDANLAMAEVSKARATIEEFLGNVRRGVDQFNGDVDKYQTALQEETDEIKAGISSYDSKAKDNFNDLREQVEQYSGDLTKYQNEVNAKLGEYRTDVQKALDEYLALLRGVVDKYQSESAADVAEFRANLERAVQKHRAGIEQELGRYGKKADVAINEYLALLRGVVDKYQAEAQADVAEFRANLERAIQKARLLIDQEVNRYRAVSDSYINEFNVKAQATINEFRARVDAVLNEYTQNNNALLDEYSRKAMALINEYTALVQGELSSVQSDMQKAQSYLNEASVRLQTMQNFDNKSAMVRSENNDLWQQYNQGIAAYISKYIPSKVED